VTAARRRIQKAAEVDSRNACGQTKAGRDTIDGVVRPRRQPRVRPDWPSQGLADPVAASYRVMRSPALAELVGDGRPQTVLMISLLSMPCR
jgi:hypothetical protein